MQYGFEYYAGVICEWRKSELVYTLAHLVLESHRCRDVLLTNESLTKTQGKTYCQDVQGRDKIGSHSETLETAYAALA
jgi:hypothetical protein